MVPESVLALVHSNSGEKISRLADCIENGQKHKVLLDRG